MRNTSLSVFIKFSRNSFTALLTTSVTILSMFSIHDLYLHKILYTVREKWIDINITVEEDIHELSSINCITINTGAVKYNQIPEARELGSILLKALSITLQKAIPSSGISVSTRKKLEPKRNKQ